MDQLRNLIANLSVKQRISLVLAAVLVLGGLYSLSKWNKERDFKPLFNGLAAEDAGALLTRLREANVEYRLSENGTSILVPSNKVAELRLQLASAGLPKSGRIGFELFDKNNFGTTDFTEQVNYHRAVEGELERSVISLSEVEQARIHISFPKDSVFVESRQPAKASVAVKLRPGAKLSAQNVLAICHLISSAVEGLNPESVSVLDMNGNLLNRPRKISPDGNEPSEAVIEYRQKIEKDLIAKIHATLEPLLGQDKFRAGVYVDCDFTSGEQSEETLDPTKSVMLTSMKTEEGGSAGISSGMPGTASNLPRPAAKTGGGSGSLSRQTENVTYQTSRTVKHTRLPQGNIRKISASLLIDQSLRWEGVGDKAKRVIEPPSPEKLKAIKDLVSGAIGLSTERGDQLIVETLPFESTLTAERPQFAPAAAPAPGSGITLPPWLQKLVGGQNNVGIVVGAGAAVILFVLVGLVIIVRKLTRKKAASVTMAKEVSPGRTRGALSGASEEAGRDLESALQEQAAIKDKQAADALNMLKVQPVVTKKTEVLTKHIVEEAKKDPTAMAYIVRTWLNESER
jgi:flagellar M-ring protein FliF